MRINSINTQNYNNFNINNRPKTTSKPAAVNFTSRKPHTAPNERITYTEGMSILWGGVKQQISDTINFLFCNPKGIMGMLAMGAGLALLPFIGIPVSVGGSALAVIFGTAASIKTVKHCINFAKHNNNGQYDEARKNLKNLGEDSVDLALSLPFTPKAVPKLINFQKYGKIKPDKNLFKKHTVSESIDIGTAPSYNAELERSLRFRQAAANELKNSNKLSASEHRTLEKELEDYNVYIDKIPEVALDKWAKAHQIYTKPNVIIKSMPEGIAGAAAGRTCTIIINDNKVKIPPHNRYETLETKQINDIYEIKYRDKATGEIIIEEVPKKIADDYKELTQKLQALSPEVARILTIIHEREHIDQFARMALTKGINIVQPTDSAKTIYKNMIQEMTPQKRTLEKAEETAQIIADKPRNGTFAQYLKSIAEIGAREAEKQALKNPLYTHLDNICKKVNSQKPTSANYTIAMSTLRADSLAS